MHDFVVYAMLMGAVSTGGSLPYWMTTNQYGLMPEQSGAVALVQAKTQYDTSKVFQYRWGVSLAGNTNPKFIPDECYGSIKWKCLSLDLGLKHREPDFMASDPYLGSLSVTGGHFMDSGNTWAMPGYTINLHPVAIPGTKGHWIFYGAFGDYLTTDYRYIRNAMVHRTQIMTELKFGRFEFHLGLDHYAQWNGVDPVYGQQPNSFKDYLRVITGSSAGSSGTASDQYNVIGNQLGAELIKFAWQGNGWKITFQHEIPYDDKSGMKFHNFPDGNNTLHFGWDNKDRWVSDLIYEFNYTMYQSGPIHDPEFDSEGKPIPWTPDKCFDGNDDYFNNWTYKSGWTYYGRTIGCPLFFPEGTYNGTWNANRIVYGVENNRLMSHHFGMSGKLFRKHPYRLMLTYSQNYGRYVAPYTGESAYQKPWGSVQETPLWQLSFGLTGFVTDIFRVRGLALTYGLFADRGELLQDMFGATLGVTYTFRR